MKPVDPAKANPALRSSPVGPLSRYRGVEVATHITVDGREVAYFRRRFVPRPERAAIFAEHEMTQGERLDHIAARYLGSPLLAWRIADANAALDPRELGEPGRVVGIAEGDASPGGPP